VVGLEPADLEKLARAELQPEQWTALFAVRVDSGDRAQERPAMLGSYRVDQGVVRFEPRFPLTPGVRYRAVFDFTRLPGQTGDKRKPLTAEFALPEPPPTEPTVLHQVYPSGNKIPENHLRFYLHFSAPMRRGEALQHIQLLNAAGKPVEFAFLELNQELWDPQGRRFTLLINPGRIKKGLKPREEFGPVFEEGKTYTLVIDRQWSDARGQALKETYRKALQVLAPVERSLDPKTWKLSSPQAGTRQPLTVRFPAPLDHALLHRMLWVTEADNRKVAGQVEVTEAETCWQFTPERPWPGDAAGTFRLVADTRLEDLAGNSIAHPFEVDVFHPIQREVKAETVAVPFQVRPAQRSK
jgi:hypothetical protein